MAIGTASALLGFSQLISGGIQTAIGASKRRKGIDILEQIPLQDATTQKNIDYLNRKAIGISQGSGTKFSVMQNLINQGLAESMGGITEKGGSAGTTLAAYGFATNRIGKLSNQLLAAMTEDELKYLLPKIQLDTQQSQRELELNLTKSAMYSGLGAEVQQAGLDTLGSGFATIFGSDFDIGKKNNNSNNVDISDVGQKTGVGTPTGYTPPANNYVPSYLIDSF